MCYVIALYKSTFTYLLTYLLTNLLTYMILWYLINLEISRKKHLVALNDQLYLPTSVVDYTR